MSDARRGDDGVVSAVVVAMLALAGLLCLAVADAGNVLVARARAQAAADAAALAAAVAQWPFARGARDESPAQAASQVADANGAVLESCDCPVRGSSATVTVSISTRIRMLGIAPSRVSARSTSALDVGRVFEPP